MFTLTESTLLFLNHAVSRVSKKFALGGEIKNWASNVYETSESKTLCNSLASTPTSTSTPPPSTPSESSQQLDVVHSRPHSTPPESSQPAVRPRPHPTVPKPKTITESLVIASNVLVGGFDDEGLDDAIERDTAMQAVGKVYGIQVRGLVKNTVWQVAYSPCVILAIH
jgi:septal ring-binding cell division protein DamX